MGLLAGISVLPIAATLSACASYETAVQPYWSHLRQLPEQIVATSFKPDELKSLYLSTNPLVTAFAFALFLAPVFLVVSEINKNYSQVDRCWSILPTVYNVHYCVWTHLAGLPTRRMDYICVISCIWSARLTYNYWRKGGYEIGSEDYRWEILRKNMPGPLFFLFNVSFISLAQSVLLVLITTPTYILLLVSRITGDEISTADLGFSAGLLTLVVTTWFADQQQWDYQSAKQTYQKTAKLSGGYSQTELERGFVTSGLWAWSRHPNFAAEQAIWVTLYQWSCWKTDTYYNWAGVGALGYLALFQGSTWFTELITAGKYPEYKAYQARVSRFLPKLTTAFTGPLPAVDESAVVRPGAGVKKSGKVVKK